MWPFGKIRKLERQIMDTEVLVGDLESFLFLARSDRKSAAVEFAAAELEEYKRKYHE